jgi:hypothetical protein
MEYESDRAINDPQLEEAKLKALSDFDTYLGLKGEVQDPAWVKPAFQPHLSGIPIDEIPNGHWISGGRTGGKKEEQIGPIQRVFDHDLPSLLKDGPTTLPKGEWAEAKLTPAEIEGRMKAHDFTFPELLPTLAYYSPDGATGMSVDEYNKGVNIGPNNEPVFRRVFPEDTQRRPL